MNLGQAKKQYLEYLEIEKNRSHKTVENYDRYLSRFVGFVGERLGKQFDKVNTKQIDQELVRQYRLYLNRFPNAASATSDGLKKVTQNYYIIALRGFLKYMAKIGEPCLTSEQVELGRAPAHEIDIIGYDDLERLLASVKGDSIAHLRDRAILETLFSTGLRVSELCQLNRNSINLSRGEFSVKGKGDKIRLVFLSDNSREILKKYLDKRGDIEEALFVSFSKAKNPKVIGRITPRSVQRLVQYYSAKAGITRNVTPHTLRHLFATDLLQNGADLRSVQMLLGHSNVSTTQIYTHITNKELREIHQAFHGRRRNGAK